MCVAVEFSVIMVLAAVCQAAEIQLFLPSLTFLEHTVQTTVLSSKGQVVIPMRLRQSHNWAPGMTLEVEDTAQGVLLRPVRAFFTPTKHEDVMGSLKHTGPRLSDQDIEDLLMADMRTSCDNT